MKFYLPDYKEGDSVEVEWDYDPKKLDMEFPDQVYLKPVHVKGIIEKGPDTFFFRGDLESVTEQTCGRCLVQVRHPMSQPFNLIYETKDQVEIDPTDDLREALMIDHPLAFVCKQDCKGLCPQCGINFNESTCRCDQDINSKPLSKLKEIWKKNK